MAKVHARGRRIVKIAGKSEIFAARGAYGLGLGSSGSAAIFPALTLASRYANKTADIVMNGSAGDIRNGSNIGPMEM